MGREKKNMQTHSLRVRRRILKFSVNYIQSAGSQTLCGRPIPRPEESSRMCVCVRACHWMWSSATITLYAYNEHEDRGRLSTKQGFTDVNKKSPALHAVISHSNPAHTFISYSSMVSFNINAKLKLNSMALVRERTIPTERPPPVGEVSANYCG
jgi:hypothetical protein